MTKRVTAKDLEAQRARLVTRERRLRRREATARRQWARIEAASDLLHRADRLSEIVRSNLREIEGQLIMLRGAVAQYTEP